MPGEWRNPAFLWRLQGVYPADPNLLWTGWLRKQAKVRRDRAGSQACHATVRHEIGRVDTPLPQRSSVRQEGQRLRLTAAAGSAYPATKGRAGGKLPSGNVTVRFPARNFSDASR